MVIPTPTWMSRGAGNLGERHTVGKSPAGRPRGDGQGGAPFRTRSPCLTVARLRGQDGGVRLALILLLACCSAEIERGLDAESAREVVLALERTGIEATQQPGPGGSFAVSVPGRDVARALDLLRSQGLPRRPEAGLAQVYAEPALVPTTTEERARYELAVAGELAATIEGLPGVRDARVHLAAPARDAFAPPETPAPRPRASVLIHTNGSGLGTRQEDIRKLVAGAVDGLDPAGVSVVVARHPSTPVTRPAFPSRSVPAAWMGVASVLIASLAVGLVYAVSYARALRQKLRADHGRSA